tara:strand:+ start:105 stop:692 length:588 start_codon:yes stop_codon:yes gene_type:complete
MKKHLVIIGLMLMLFGCKDSKKIKQLCAEYSSFLSRNVQQRAENRVKYLELTGLFKLDSINNTFGKNPTIIAFKGFNSYQVKREFIFEGDFKYFKKKHTKSVSSKLGINDCTDFIGKVEFTYKSKSYTLDVGSQGLTSGESPYGDERYLKLELTETDEKLSLDYNYLYNPPCAFLEFTTCLFPARQNQLPIKIEA